MGAGMSEGHKALFRIAIVLLKAHTTHLSKAVDHADAMDLLCPINPLATRVPINDNDMLTKAFKLSLARKQFSVSLTSPRTTPRLMQSIFGSPYMRSMSEGRLMRGAGAGQAQRAGGGVDGPAQARQDPLPQAPLERHPHRPRGASQPDPRPGTARGAVRHRHPRRLSSSLRGV